jgi:hypothetical protein
MLARVRRVTHREVERRVKDRAPKTLDFAGGGDIVPSMFATLALLSLSGAASAAIRTACHLIGFQLFR